MKMLKETIIFLLGAYTAQEYPNFPNIKKLFYKAISYGK